MSDNSPAYSLVLRSRVWVILGFSASNNAELSSGDGIGAVTAAATDVDDDDDESG